MKKSNLEIGFEKMIFPFQQFLKDQTTSSVLLILCTCAALAIANSPFAGNYQHILHTQLGITFGDWHFSMTLKHWINEGLMTVFFLLLGMEIKREVLVGEIKERQKLIPVLAAALGGMIFPAFLFLIFNINTDYIRGWGIPMATDTAFAIGILMLIGKRAPKGAVAFLAGLAIIDDLGAILVIALFYSETLDLIRLTLAGCFLSAMILANLLGIRHPFIYLIGGAGMWSSLLHSGFHATVAGILLASTIPARTKKDPSWLVHFSQRIIKRIYYIDKAKPNQMSALEDGEQHELIEKLQRAAARSSTPLRRWEVSLTQPVSLFVMPIFALTNAGIELKLSGLIQQFSHPLSQGIISGLLIGKVLGIFLFTWTVLHFKLGQLPEGMSRRHLMGIGLLGGIGFTMSIFISNLAFNSSPEDLIQAKGSILFASFIAGVLGYFSFRWVTPKNTGKGS